MQFWVAGEPHRDGYAKTRSKGEIPNTFYTIRNNYTSFHAKYKPYAIKSSVLTFGYSQPV